MQFVNSYFLWALGLLAIPIIIHLFQFRRYKKVFFSNVAFLKSIQLESTNRNKLKHLLVLASRLLAFAFLIIAFAQPFIPAKNSTESTGKKYVSVFVDNSFSMLANNNGSSLLEEAKETARAIVKGYATDDLFQILTQDFSGKQQRLLSKEEALSMIDEISKSAASRPWNEIQKRQKDVLSRDNSPNQLAYLISDVQKNMGLIQDIRTVQYNLIPLKAQKQANLFIDTCYFYEPVQLLNQKNKLIVKIRNAGEEDVTNLRVSLSINGQAKALANPSIKAGTSTLDTLYFTISETGWNKAEVAIEDFPITFDDKFFISFYVLDKINVQELKEANSGNYIGAVFKQQTEFNFQSNDLGNINYGSLAQTQFICLTNVKSISSGLSDELKKFVENGGAILISPNENADLNSINAFLKSMQVGQLGALISEDIEGGSINLYQKIIRDLFDKIPENIQLPKIKKHFSFTSGSVPIEAIFTLKNGDKSLLASKVKNGYLYLCTSPFDVKINELVAHSMFAPIIYKMAVLSAKSANISSIIGSKSPIELQTDIDQKENVLKLSGVDVEFIPEQYTIGNKTYILPKENVRNAGFYKVSVDKSSKEQYIALNYNRNESILAFEDPEKLKQSAPNLHVINTTGMEALTISKELGRGTPLWKYFLMLALLFLAVEIGLLLLW